MANRVRALSHENRTPAANAAPAPGADALERLLAADGDPSRSAEVLATVARIHHVDAVWLLTGESDFHSERYTPEARLRIADLLMRVGMELLSSRAARRSVGGPRAARASGEPPVA